MSKFYVLDEDQVRAKEAKHCLGVLDARLSSALRTGSTITTHICARVVCMK